jgi:ribosomal protein S18 acetylase RimI-like enzyme
MIDRLRAARERLARHADATLAGLTDPDAATGERWDAGQVWAHLAEFVSFWLAQAADVVSRAGRGEPQPIAFGRTKDDPERIAVIERDRNDDPRALMGRVASDLDAVIATFDRWSVAQRAARGLHSRLGEMSAERIIERFVVEHLEEHAAQLDDLAAAAHPAVASVMERITAFSRGIEDRSSTRRLQASVGTLLLNDDYPFSHANNMLRVEGPQPSLSAEELDAEATRLLRDEAGRKHLQVLIEDEATAARLAPALKQLGWSVTPLVYMALRGEPSIPSPARAEVVDWDAVRPLVQADFRSDPQTSGEEVVRQLTDRREAIARATHLRHVAAPVGGPYASRADLYSDGRTLQIESVVTLGEARNQGLARAVVLEGVRVAREEGHDLVFLVAEEDDWPKALYQRLGFEIVGRSTELGRD